jgi:hypothetical protein
VIGRVAAAERYENDVLGASPLNLPGTDHAPGIGEQYDFEQDFGVEGGCTGIVVLVSPFKHREIEMIFHQFVDRVFQCPRYELVLQGDGEHDQLIIIARFEFSHRFLYLIDKYTEPFGLLLLISSFFDSFNGRRYRQGRELADKTTRRRIRRWGRYPASAGAARTCPQGSARGVGRLHFSFIRINAKML